MTREQYLAELNVYRSLVGTLYPGVVWPKLVEAWEQLKDPTLPYPPAPRLDGRVPW